MTEGIDDDHWHKTALHLEMALWELESARFKMIGQGDDRLNKYSMILENMLESLVRDMIDYVNELDDYEL